MKRVLHSTLLLCMCAAPFSASAAVLITEIMYDLEGADGGYEWVEVTNTGAAPVDIGAWRLFEQGVNHKLTLFAGTNSVLQPGASALIADKPDNIVSRYPHLDRVFDSAFSLSNEGETLMLKNAAGTVVDQATYRSSLGAKGDGASLHLVGEVLMPALPNPGVYPGELVPVVKKVEAPKANTPATTALARGSVVQEGSELAASAALTTPRTPSIVPWLVGLASIIVLGIAGVLLVKTEQGAAVTSRPAEEFEIVEDEQKLL